MKLLLLIPLFLSNSIFALEVKFIKNLDTGKPQKIVVYGTSLTAKGPWVSILEKKLKNKYGESATLINSGGSGKDSNWGLQQLQKRVIEHKPNAVFIEFGMNDAVVRFKNSKEKVKQNLVSMIIQIKASSPKCEIILMTMNPALGIPEGHRSSRSDLNAYYEIYRELAKEHKLLLIDHYVNWQNFLDKKGNEFKKYIPDGIHPNKSGCEKVILPELIKVLNLKIKNVQQR